MGFGWNKKKKNKNQLILIENIEVPNIPIEIIEIFKNDYQFIKKLLEYKKDPTLALLKVYNAIFVYDDDFNLKIVENVTNLGRSCDSAGIPSSQPEKIEWCQFFENIKKNYAKKLIKEGLNLFKNKYNDSQIISEIDEKFFAPILEKIFDEIYQSFSKKFSFQKDMPEKQNDYINIDLKDKTDINKIRYYWIFKGVIFAQITTKYNELTKDNYFIVEFNGNPKFQIVAFELNFLNYFKKNESNLKKIIDVIDDKIIEKNFKNYNI